MSLTYTAFKAHILKFLWKQHDQDLAASFDLLVQMANSELNVALNISANEVTDDLIALTDELEMPAGFKSVRLLMSPQLGELSYLTPSDLLTRRVVSSGTTLPYYSLEGAKLLLCFFPNPLDASPTLPLTVTYNREIPDYSVTDTSWFADKHLSLYVYAVLLQTAPFLREDERVALWQARYDKMLYDLKEEDAFFRVRGVAGRSVAQSPSSV